jgi:hypothetical protein
LEIETSATPKLTDKANAHKLMRMYVFSQLGATEGFMV